MTNNDKTRQLSVEQLNAIDLLVLGKTDEEVAAAVGVVRQTVNEWRNRNAAFLAELNVSRELVWGQGKDRLRALVAQAVEVLEENLNQSADPRLRQQAAVHLLRAAGLYGAALEPTGDTEPEAIEAKWRLDEEARRIQCMMSQKTIFGS